MREEENALAQELARFSGARLIQSTLTPLTVQRLRNVLAPTAVSPGE